MINYVGHLIDKRPKDTKNVLEKILINHDSSTYKPQKIHLVCTTRSMVRRRHTGQHRVLYASSCLLANGKPRSLLEDKYSR